MNQNWTWLSETAMGEVEALLQALPRDVRAKADSLPVLYERRPGKALVATGIEPDILGLFDGPSMRDGEGSEPTPPSIVLFLDNLWDSTKPDKALYRREVRTTYLHELGHYLGLEEEDMESRLLD